MEVRSSLSYVGLSFVAGILEEFERIDSKQYIVFELPAPTYNKLHQAPTENLKVKVNTAFTLTRLYSHLKLHLTL
jgi:hypothetical protein